MPLPGITFETVDSAGPFLGARADRAGLVALTERGPVEVATLVHSEDEFLEVFGCPIDGMLGPLGAKAFYANQGEELVVSRFVPAEAAAATGELPVVEASESGAFEVEFEARYPGGFANQLELDALISVRTRGKGGSDSATTVVFGDLVDPLFVAADVGMPVRVVTGSLDAWTLVAAVGPLVGVTQELTLADALLPGPGVATLVEVHEPTFALRISEPNRATQTVPGLDLRDPVALEELLSSTPVRSTTVATSDAELPQPGVRVRLEGGDDGLTSGGSEGGLRESFERALSALERSALPDILVAPDLWSRIYRTKGVSRLAFEPATAVALGDELVRSAARTQDRVALVDPPLGGPDGLEPAGPTELAAWAKERGVQLPEAQRDFAATYSPWTRIVAGPVFKGDDTLIVPPSAFVAGQIARTNRRSGPWVATGNVALQQVVGLAQTLSAAQEEQLQEVGVNPLRRALPQGTIIRGVRSLSSPDRKPWRFLSTRQLFNFLRRALTPVGMSYVFEPNSPATWIQLRRDVERLLESMFSHGAFAGSTPGEAFFVKIDESINPESAREAGVLSAEIGVAPAQPLEFLVVRLQLAEGTSNVLEQAVVQG